MLVNRKSVEPSLLYQGSTHTIVYDIGDKFRALVTMDESSICIDIYKAGYGLKREVLSAYNTWSIITGEDILKLLNTIDIDGEKEGYNEILQLKRNKKI